MKKKSIYDTHYKPTLKGYFMFELKSFLGRKFLTKNVSGIAPILQYCYLGCGQNLIEGENWVNADFFVFNKKKRSLLNNYWMVDLRYPLSCHDNCFEGVVTEHTFEHLYPDEVESMCAEILRCLKPGGLLRIVVPDLAKHVGFYTGTYKHEEFECFDLPGDSIRTLTQDYLHHSCWDSSMMISLLERVGFKNVKEVSLNVSSNADLLINKPEREWESLYIEAAK
jgi:predicted SAM-dependent methyltransferase